VSQVTPCFKYQHISQSHTAACYRMKPAWKGTARDRNFFRCRKGPFNTGIWNLYPHG